MQTDTFILWAKYNKTANKKMNDVIKTLTPTEWDKSLGGYFGSIRHLCSHLYICDYNWLKYFSKLRDFSVLKEKFFAREKYLLSDILFPDMREYLEKRPMLDDKIIDFTSELIYGDLNTFLNCTNSQGAACKRIFGGLLMQCFNHDTHHRGMISI